MIPLSKAIFMISLLLTLTMTNVTSKSLVKKPITFEDENKANRVIQEATPLPMPQAERSGKENNAAESDPFDESTMRERQGVQVSVRMLPQQSSPNKQDDRDMLPTAAATVPVAKPIQMTLTARQTPPGALVSTLNHQVPPRRNTPTPRRDNPNSAELVASLVGVDVDENSDDPFSVDIAKVARERAGRMQ